MTLPLLSDDERRRRIAVRHGLAPDARLGSAEAVARAVVGLHATEQASVHLSVWARTDHVEPHDITRALEVERTLVRQVSMRRTLFAVPTDLRACLLGSAAARAAAPQRRRLLRAIEASGLASDPDAWLARVSDDVVRALDAHGPLRPPQLREAVGILDTPVNVAPGTKWGRPLPVSQYVLDVLTAEGTVVRAGNAGGWHQPRPTYASADAWLPGAEDSVGEREGYAEVVRRWLAAFGPGTEADLVWWLGATKTAVRNALRDVDAAEVVLEDGATAWVLPGDTGPTDDPGPWAALLPVLDPTTMGWRGRDFYLSAADVRYLVDSVGNASTTAWWNGRIVGCWVQEEDATVRVVPRGELPSAARRALAHEADRLTAWLAGTMLGLTYNRAQSAGAPLP